MASTINSFGIAFIPSSPGVGAAFDVSDMSAEKTFTFPPIGDGMVVVEVSCDGGVSFAPLFAVLGPLGEAQTSSVRVTCDHIRVRRASGSGDAGIHLDFAAEQGDPFFATLPQDGTPVSVSHSFSAKSIVVTGNFSGEVVVSGTADGDSFNPIPGVNIKGPGVFSFDATYVSMRVESVTLLSGSLGTVSVGAVGAFVGSVVNAITPGTMIDINPPSGHGVVEVSVIPGDDPFEMNAVGTRNQPGVLDEASRADHTHKGAIGNIMFAGVLVGGVGAVFTYLANEGIDGVANQTTALRYPTSERNVIRLRVDSISDSMVNDCTATVYQNGSPTAMTVTIPGGTSAYTQFLDDVDNILYADGDDFDLRLDNPGADVGHTLKVSAAMEYISPP